MANMYVPPAFDRLIKARQENLLNMLDGEDAYVSEWEAVVSLLDEQAARQFWEQYEGEKEPIHA